jgi:integrase
MNKDGSFKDSYSLQPKKTKKTGKYVKLYFNEAVKKAITDYLKIYPIKDLDEYLFKSRVGNGHITEKSLGRIIKDTAEEVGIDRNVNSHSLRKSFGFWVWHNAEDKEKSLVMLMTIFNHSSVAITKKYIGLMDEEIESVFNELNLGLNYLD